MHLEYIFVHRLSFIYNSTAPNGLCSNDQVPEQTELAAYEAIKRLLWKHIEAYGSLCMPRTELSLAHARPHPTTDQSGILAIAQRCAM